MRKENIKSIKPDKLSALSNKSNTIRFESARSIYYDRNKAYCDEVAKVISNLGGSVSGFCTSYGYHVRGQFDQDLLTLKPIFGKQQIGGKKGFGVGYYWFFELEVTGLNNRIEVEIIENSFKRWFTKDAYKQQFPNSSYVTITPLPSNAKLQKINHFVETYKITKLTIQNGTLHFTIPNKMNNPAFIDDCNDFLDIWKR